MEKIRVLLADDHTLVREGLRAVIAAAEDMEIVGEAENGRQAVQLARILRPDVAIIDVAMPILNGLEAMRQTLEVSPGTRVLILSMYADDEVVRQSVAYGAMGYLVKQSAANDLLRAISAVHKGAPFFSPSIAARMREIGRPKVARGGVPKSRLDDLTTREAEILQLIAEGGGNKQIAAELGISVKTVEKHRQQLMKKLGIHDIAGLTRYAISKGMIENQGGLQAIGGEAVSP